LGFFGVHGERDAALAGRRAQLHQTRGQLLEHALALVEHVRRKQRRQVRGNARRLARRRPPRPLSQRLDGGFIRIEVTLSVLARERRLAQHVVRMPESAVLGGARALQRLLDSAPHDELMTHDPHRVAECGALSRRRWSRSEEHASELQSRENIVCRLLLEKKKSTYFRR